MSLNGEFKVYRYDNHWHKTWTPHTKRWEIGKGKERGGIVFTTIQHFIRWTKTKTHRKTNYSMMIIVRSLHNDDQ